MEESIVDRARMFAKTAHGLRNQRRKYTDEPYSVHPGAVAAIVALTTTDDEVIAAAWLHDVLEDTTVTYRTIEDQFGMKVAKLVEEVTDASNLSDGNRERRKSLDRHHLSHASPEGQTIKLADLIDNSESIVKYDPRFASIFMREMDLLLDVLVDGDRRLRRRARKIVRSFELENPRGTSKARSKGDCGEFKPRCSSDAG